MVHGSWSMVHGALLLSSAVVTLSRCHAVTPLLAAAGAVGWPGACGRAARPCLFFATTST